MCGFVGVISFDASEREELTRASEVIGYRGPDDHGEEWFDAGSIHGGLACRRLSILDLSPAGHMPMKNAAGTVLLAYNGEIYNFPEIRERLLAEGVEFRSSGDTEVVLHAYERYGDDCVAMFNGMFAFALWDSRRERLLLARDRFGIKPLYYHDHNGSLRFASEVKALLKLRNVPRDPDLTALDAAITFMGVPGDRTGFRNIRKLLPAHYLVWEKGTTSVRRFAEMSFETSRDPEADLTTRMRDVLDSAVRRQMVSDVPLGAFLSGGLDSSALVAFMARASSQVRTYTIVYREEDQRWERGASEASYARLVAERFGTNHQEIVVEPRVVDLLPKITWHLDEPIGDPAAISTFLISEQARKEVKVLLAGQGADEIFAGYHFYPAHRYSEAFAHVPAPVGRLMHQSTQATLGLMSRVAPGQLGGRILAVRRYADLIMRNAYLPSALRHASYHAYFDREQKRQLYSPQFASQLNGSDPLAQYSRLFDEVSSSSNLNRFLYMDIRTHLPDLILNYSDKLSMAASVELRVPFLDNELVAFAATLPADMKLRGSTGKYLFRRAMRGILPDEILTRRKAPFGVPVRGWLRRDLVPLVDDLLSETCVKRRGLFNYAAVRNTIEQSRRSLGTSAHQIWALLTLELWFRIFID